MTSFAVRARILSGVFFVIIAVVFAPYINNKIVPQQVHQPDSYLTSELAKQRPLVLCHRGSRYMAPENTIHAIKWALEMGCDVIETDVRLTKDNKLVHIHDDDVDRICNKVGDVRSFTYDELKEMDCAYHFTLDNKTFPFRGQGFHPHLFNEFLDAFPTQFINIEIKENEPIVAEMVWDEIRTRKAQSRTVVSSRYCEVLNHFRKISNYTVATGACELEGLLLVFLTRLGMNNIFFSLYKPQAQVYQVPVVSSGTYIASQKLVDAAHATNQKIQFWVLNNENTMKDILKLNVDGFVTDRTDIADKVLVETGYKDSRKFTNIPAEFINSTKGFFVPYQSPSEIHQCVSLSCKILPHVYDWLELVIAGIAFSIGLILLFATRNMKDPLQASELARPTKKKSKPKKD